MAAAAVADGDADATAAVAVSAGVGHWLPVHGLLLMLLLVLMLLLLLLPLLLLLLRSAGIGQRVPLGEGPIEEPCGAVCPGTGASVEELQRLHLADQAARKIKPLPLFVCV